MNLIRKKPIRDLLSHKQFEINKKQREQTLSSYEWLHEQGISIDSFTSTNLTLLKTQQLVHQILKHHQNLLTEEQQQTIENFQKKMKHKNTRKKLNLKAVIPVLNISSKIHRQLFRQHRKLIQSQTGNTMADNPLS